MDGQYDHGFGRTWTEVSVAHKEGYQTSVSDFHRHGFYEINLVFSGNIRILLEDQSLETNRQHLVLTAPGTPHFISCRPDTLYSRLYLSFAPDFVEGQLPQWPQLRQVFGSGGRIVPIRPSEMELCRDLIHRIDEETSPLRQQLLIGYLLSCIADFQGGSAVSPAPAPACVIQALSYIDQHYSRKIVAGDLAAYLHVGRTTLMTAFKKHTGATLNEYLTRYRLNKAELLLRQGSTVQEAAERCGFLDSGSLIRSFRRCLGTTPRRYLTQHTEK